MADVFVSYARSTESCARAVAEIIEGDGYTVWYDARLPAHRVYADVIREQIDAAQAVLIIWSEEATRSQWVRSEADRGRQNGTLIQFRIDDCVLPMPFDQIQCPLVRDWQEGRSTPQLVPILESLSELLNGVPAAIAVTRPPHQPLFSRSEEGQLLFEAASRALQSGDPVEHAQAIPLLIEATTVGPDDAAAWGLLAVLYAARRLEVSPADRPAMIARAQSAIRTALKLDPADVRARCAEVILITPFQNWSRKEQSARKVLSEAPAQPVALFSLATVLGHVGRWAEAADTVSQISRTKFLLPVVDEFTVHAFWSAGDLVQAELAGERAARRFPSHVGLWEARIDLLMHSGRAADAIELLDNERTRPSGYPSEKLDAGRLAALALVGKTDKPAAIRKNLEALAHPEAGVVTAALYPLKIAQRCAALGNLDECFRVLDGYYFGEGPWAVIAPAGGDEDRLTWPLFTPAMTKAWTDNRFDALTAALGLNAYWDEAVVQPDFSRDLA